MVNGNPITLPIGTAIVCKNWETARDNVYRIPRGRDTYVDLTTLPDFNINTILDYGDLPILHFSNNTLYRDTGAGGIFAQIVDVSAGVDFNAPDANFRIEDTQFASNWYITTSAGIQKLDAVAGAARYAGIQKALGFDLRIIDDINWLTNLYTVAYRIVWSYEDANENLITGAPSERIEVTNNAGADRAVELKIQIPTETTVNYKYGLYRSTMVNGTPPEDLQLVYEDNPTAAEVVAGMLTVNDILPEGFRGASLYTNITQEGILQQNDRPPLATTMGKYKEYMIYGNVEGLERLYTNLISVTNITGGTSTLTVSNATTTIVLGFFDEKTATVGNVANNGAGLCRVTTTAAHGLITGDYTTVIDVTGTVEANGGWIVTRIDDLNVDLQASAYVNAHTGGGTLSNILNRGYGIASSADNGAGLVRYTTTATHGLTTADYVLIYDDTGTTAANGVHAVLATPAATTFDINVAFVGNSTATANFYEDIGVTPRAIRNTSGTDAQNIDRTARSIVRTLNLASGNTIIDVFYTSGATDPSGKMELVSKALGDAVFYLIVDSVATGSCFSPVIPIAGTDYSSTNSDLQNAIMWSKQGQAEAVPTVNFKAVGNKGDPILKVIGLRDSVFIIKQEDGIYRMTGETPSDWVVTEFDGTLECTQRNSIQKGENAIFMMTNLGYVQISDAGIEIIGRDNEFKDLQPSLNANYEEDGAAWFYESDKTYYCSTHNTTASTDNDIVHTFNTYTRSWSDREHGIYTNDTNIRDGRVIDNLLYTAPLTGKELLKERKAFAVTDHATPDIDVIISAIDVATNTVTLAVAIDVPIESNLIQGAYTKTIIEKSSGTEWVLSNVNNLTAAAAIIRPGIVSTLKYQQIHCGSPEYGKQFRKFQVFFDNDETNIKNMIAKTYTDLDTTAREVLFNDLDLEYWGKKWGVIWGSKRVKDKWLFLADGEHHRGSVIYLELTHRVPQEQCAITGISVLYENLTERPTD